MKLLKCRSILLALWLAYLNDCLASSIDNDFESVRSLLTDAMENRSFNGAVAIKHGDAPIKTYTAGWFREDTPLTNLSMLGRVYAFNYVSVSRAEGVE